VFDNDPVIHSVLMDLTLFQNQETSLSVRFSDSDTSFADLTIAATSNNQDLISDGDLSFSDSEGGEALSLSPLEGQTGEAVITVMVDDGENQTTERFLVTVLNKTPELVLEGGRSVEGWDEMQRLEARTTDAGIGHNLAMSDDGHTAVVRVPPLLRVIGRSPESDTWSRIGGWDINVTEPGYSQIFIEDVSISGDGSAFIVAYRAVKGSGLDTETIGRVAVYQFARSTNAWYRRGQTLGGASEYLTGAVALSSDGKTAVVREDPGHVRIYSYDSIRKMWSPLGQELTEEFSQVFGSDVDISADGRTVIIADTSSSSRTTRYGYARVYHFDDVSKRWKRLGQDMASEEESLFGGKKVSLSADGLTAAVEFRSKSKDEFVQVFGYNILSEMWVPQNLEIGEIFAQRTTNKRLQLELSSDGNSAIVGSLTDERYGNSSGTVAMIRRNPFTGNWSQTGAPIHGDDEDQFGSSVALSATGQIAMAASIPNDWPESPPGFVRTFRLSSVYRFSVVEDETFVANLGVIDDVDIEEGGITYSLSGADAQIFTIDTVGVIRFRNAADFENPAVSKS